MNSKFFSTENQYISDDESDTNSIQSKDENRKLPNLRFDDDYSSEDTTRRVVRREKDKRYESMKLVISHINAKIKIEDFVLMLVEFDELNKLLEKSKRVIEKEGIPRFYIRICSQLESFLANLPTETKNNLKPANKRAYNTLKHKVRKNNKLYENYIKTFLEDPVDSDTSEEPEFEEESSIDEQREEDDRALRRRYLRSSDPMVRRNYWLKREPKVPIVSKPNRPNPVINVEDTNVHIDNDSVLRNETTPKEIPRKRYALDNMEKTIEHILERRVGKGAWAKDKNITLEEELNILQNYYEQASGTDLNRLEILFVLLPIRMDFSRQYSHYYMPRNLWLENFKNLEEIFKIISNKKNVLGQVRTFNRDGELFYKEKATLDLFCAHFEGLENELSKAFRETESSSMDYIERLSDNALLIRLAYEAYLHFNSGEDTLYTVKFAQKYFEYTYYMPDKLFEKLRVSAKVRGISSKSEFYEKPVTETLMKELATKVYSSADSQMIVKTVLQHIYNHAINGRYQTAKEMFQMSHIAKISSNLDSGIQILYNRTLVQLGLCAFSHGSIRDCIDALDEIAGSGRLRELIGQGVSRSNVKGDETRNLLPNHMHIDVEIVQAVHLIATMLVEIPNTLATDCYDVNKRPVSRVFKRQYEAYKNFHGLPETDRDYIMIAGKELATGDWRSCYQLLLSTRIWAKLTQNVKLAKENLLTQVKQQALKCELLNCQNYYESLEISILGGKFELNIESLQFIINHAIFNMEIQAYVDIQSNCIVFQNRSLTKLESRALGLTEKVCNLVENNEKIMNSKYGSSSVSDKDMTETTVRKRKGATKKFNAIIGKEDRKIRAIKTLKI